MSFSESSIARYMQVTSAIKAMLWSWKWIKGGCTVGPTIRVELGDMPLVEVAEASNTAHTLDSNSCRQSALADRILDLEVSLNRWWNHFSVWKATFSTCRSQRTGTPGECGFPSLVVMERLGNGTMKQPCSSRLMSTEMIKSRTFLQS